LDKGPKKTNFECKNPMKLDEGPLTGLGDGSKIDSQLMSSYPGAHLFSSSKTTSLQAGFFAPKVFPLALSFGFPFPP
jgi:hypothetical protein